jgi:hypothetical protein
VFLTVADCPAILLSYAVPVVVSVFLLLLSALLLLAFLVLLVFLLLLASLLFKASLFRPYFGWDFYVLYFRIRQIRR